MRHPSRLLSLCVLLSACGSDVDKPVADTDAAEPVPLVAGTPTAGMADAFLSLPVGSPLGGYTERCECFGGVGLRQEALDNRDSAYVTDFVPSAGIHTRPHAVALWLDNGDQAVVMLKTDAIYAFEGVVEALEERLSAETGWDLAGRITFAVNHTHAATANYDKGLAWFLGGDRFNQEIFDRLVDQLATVALEAFDSRQDAAIGVGRAQDWDPDDRVYRDRRPENDDRQWFDDVPAGPWKDPHLTVLRVDTAAGDPIGMLYAFGIHGTALSANNALSSTEAPGGTEIAVMSRFDEPMVVGFMQHGGGDISPAGVDRGFAKIESVGELAADAIHDLWEATPTSSAPLTLETVSHAVGTSRDELRVTRNGTVDLYYAPFDPDATPDDEVFDADGNIISPIDEFNVPYGAAFCGDETPLIPGVGVGSEVYPYESCVDVEPVSIYVSVFFELDTPELPLIDSTKASVTTSLWGPVTVLQADGTTIEDDVLWGFFPGETTTVFSETFRRRAESELGITTTIPIGYAQDHEGYLLVAEDWLSGGYEPQINLWGPLQGEHILEHALTMTEDWLLTNDVAEPMDPDGLYARHGYSVEGLPPKAPEQTPTAGTLVSAAPDYIYSPLGEDFIAETDAPDTVPRVQGIVQLMWEGGDPGVDIPVVVLERYDDDLADWVEVTTPDGRPITEAYGDILLTHTPDPLYPYDIAQTHTWWALWQAAPHTGDRASLELGTYRLHVYGHTYAGGATEWPWPADPYELTSSPFEIEPAVLDVRIDADTVSVSLPAPSHGYRLVHLEGDSRGDNPVSTDLTLTWIDVEGVETTEPAGATSTAGGRTQVSVSVPEDAVQLIVTDAYGNEGSVSL